MATLKTCTVDPGGTGDYLTLNAAEAANFKATGANLVSNDEYVVCSCICTNGAADTTPTTINLGNAAYTDATHTITVAAGTSYKHNGTYQTGNKYRLESSVDNNFIVISQSYVTFRYLQVKMSVGTGSADRCIYISGAIDGTLIDSCIIALGDSAASMYGISNYATGATAVNKIVNCILINITGQAIQSNTHASGTTLVYNCTVKGPGGSSYGYHITAGVFIVVNSIAFNCTDGFYGTFTLSSNNASSNSDAPGASAQDLAGHAGTEIFRDYANDDFHLHDNAPHVKSAGADLRTDATLPVTVDIDGHPRDSTPDIGADEIFHVENTICDTIVDLIDADTSAGYLSFCNAADVEVARCTFSKPAFGTAGTTTTGIATASAITGDSNCDGGTIASGHVYVKDGAGNTVLTATISTSPGADLQVASLAIGAGDTMNVSSLTATVS